MACSTAYARCWTIEHERNDAEWRRCLALIGPERDSCIAENGRLFRANILRCLQDEDQCKAMCPK